MGKAVELLGAIGRLGINKTRVIDAVRRGAIRVMVDEDLLNDPDFAMKPLLHKQQPEGCIRCEDAAKLYGLSLASICRYKAQGILQGPVGIFAIYEGQEDPRVTMKKRAGIDKQPAVGDGSLNASKNRHAVNPGGLAGRA